MKTYAYLPGYPATTNIETKRCSTTTQAWGTQPGRLTPAGLIERRIYEVQHDTPAAGEQRGSIEDGIVEGHILRVPAVLIPEPTPEELLTLKAAASQEIDAKAGEIRSIYITVSPGQEVTYQIKEAQCEAFKSTGYPEAEIASYPMVNAEATTQGVTGQVACDIILAQRDQWVQLAAQIELYRRSGKIAVAAAQDKADMDTARETALAALEALRP